MQKIIQSEADVFLTKKRRRRLWTKVVSVLGCVVVFCTTYALILPAITAEKTICGFEEHTHSDECYSPLPEEPQVILNCTYETLGVHSHTEACYDADGNLICGQADYVVHSHDDNCFDAEGNLICALPEIAAHIHTEECYAPVNGHVHTEECTELQQGGLICPLEESEGHAHSEECYAQTEVLICTLEEDESHTHGPECYEQVFTLVCTLAESEGHTHSAECYEQTPVTVCTFGDQGEPELICGQAEAPVHQHTENCFETVEPVRELICELPEHVHTDACYEELTPGDPTADLETAADWEASISGVALTGDYRADLLAIAQTQLGYHESVRNFIIDEAGLVKGYTRYGQWYGIPYGDWCAMFVSFCLHYAEVPNFPYNAGCTTWINALSSEEYGLYEEAGEYDPQPGDIIFFDYDGDKASDHVGIVEEISDTAITTIEGNFGDAVVKNEYDKDDTTILGFGVLPAKEKQILTQTAVIYTDSSYLELAEDDSIITLTGYLPDNAEVRAYPVSVESEEQVLFAYDITVFLPDGTLFQPEDGSSLTVSIQSPALADSDLGDVVHPQAYFVPEEGEPELLETTTTEEGVAFDAEHFSVYMVRAVTGTQVRTSSELKTAISNGDSYIQLAADFTSSEAMTLPENADITLDLNGHSLTASGPAALFTVPEGTTLTIVDSQQANETVKAASGSLAGNTASLSDGTLTYYVTTSAITNAATGATQESLEKHTVSTAGSIVGGSQPVFQLTGGTLNLQSGMIRSGTGRAIVQTSGTADLSGGYICGFTQSSSSTDNTSFGGAIKASGGVINLSGSVIAGNTAHNGGAIYATGSASLSITGGIVTGNIANRTTSGWNDHSESGAYRCGGGGIYADGNTEITMSGGYVTNNKASHDGYFDGGGGLCLSGTASMALSGGYVTGNQAQGGGGIRTDFGKETTFIMTGGFVAANVATHSEGGGIAIDRNGVGTITGGYITNNTIPNTGHWGGGGLFCADGSTLNLKNTLITNNTCGGFGAGVAGCPTGQLYLYVTEGCAIYDNRDIVDGDSPHFTSDGVKQIDKEICTEVFQSNGHADYFCALNSTVAGTMLGNNAANWKGSADYQPVIADAEDLLTATRVMGLKADPTEEAKSAAQSAARVYINGNYSYTHGGGIMCNGNLVIGVPVDVEVPARIDLQASKKLVDGSGNAQSLEDNNFSFKVTMTEPDGTVIASGICDSSGKITFDHQLTFKQEGTFVYYIYEETNEGNASLTYDSTLYRLTVTVKRDNGVAWYGDTIKYTYSVTSVKVESSADGETWRQVSQNSETQSGIISLPLTSGTTFTNHIVEPTKVTVQKKWEGGTGADSVTVILKQDGVEFDRQTLNNGNNWTYTWDDLDPGHSYTVEEVEIPGYTASYEIIISTDDSGSVSLGQGSWWVPATSLTKGQQYLIVSPDGSKALHVASGGEGDGFNTADVTSVTQQQTAITINDQTYSTWYQTSDIPARSIYNAVLLTRNSNSGIILKRSDGGSYPYLRLESNNNNYFKGASSTDYASFMVFDGTYLRGHNKSEWTPDALRTVIYTDGKFNTTTEQSPANAVKLYTLVSGEAYTGKRTDMTTVVITNTKVVVPEYELPETGGSGTGSYALGGMLLVLSASLLLLYNHTRHRKEDTASS